MSQLPPIVGIGESSFPRDWTADDWELFALRLVQLRHGPQNVQRVPHRVQGDAGIDFFTTDGCCYQCYAPIPGTEPAASASKMKQKATRDLSKLLDNHRVIEKLLRGIQVGRWILLCPYVDDKSVIEHIRAKCSRFVMSDIHYIDQNFQALVQSLPDFASEWETLRTRSIGLPIQQRSPTDEETELHYQRVQLQLDRKLSRVFPELPHPAKEKKKREFIRVHLTCANTLDSLKLEFPERWESYRHTVGAEERRLETLGPSPGEPREQLHSEQQRLEHQLSDALRGFHQFTITDLATGTVATWLIECPLGFDDGGTQ